MAVVGMAANQLVPNRRDCWAPLSTPISLFCSPHLPLEDLHTQPRRRQVHS